MKPGFSYLIFLDEIRSNKITPCLRVLGQLKDIYNLPNAYSRRDADTDPGLRHSSSLQVVATSRKISIKNAFGAISMSFPSCKHGRTTYSLNTFSIPTRVGILSKEV